jgi:peptidyl-tRNA hydrolase, PTH1 family
MLNYYVVYLVKTDQMEPFIIFGLGNPGREYERTRHNIGFIAIDKLSIAWKIDLSRVRYKSINGEGRFDQTKVILVKPLTFMNRSGNAVQSFINFYKITPDRVLVIHDDLDLPFGSLRIRSSGGSAGQRGMQSIITRIGTNEFARLRVGIGRPPGRMEAADYVLQKFSEKDQKDLDFVLEAIVDAVETLIKDGVEKAMTLYNHSVLDDE